MSMRMRNAHDAILVGIGTVLADDPDLGARLGGIDHARDPMRVVLDSELRTPPTARVLPKNRAKARRDVKCIIACGKRAPKDKEAALVAKGAEVLAPAAARERQHPAPRARPRAGVPQDHERARRGRRPRALRRS